MPTSLHKSWALMVAKTPYGLCNFACNKPMSNFVFFLDVVDCGDDMGEVANSLDLTF